MIHFRTTAHRSALLCLALLLGGSPLLEAQRAFWAGMVVSSTGWVTTPDTFFGRLQVGRYANLKWVYSEGIGSYFYLPAAHMTDEGAWAYLPILDPLVFDDSAADAGWLYARNSGTWIHAPAQTVQQARGWAYVLNNEAWEGAPEKIVLTAAATAVPADPATEDRLPRHTNVFRTSPADLARFANALRISPAEFMPVMDHDADVVVSAGSDQVTFTSGPAAFGNQFVRIAYNRNHGGLLDLTALQGISGRIVVTVHADVDLSQSTGGFYSRLKSGDREVGAYSRLESGQFEADVLLETYMTNLADDTYVEFTLPRQGSITVKNIYLHMETGVRGFADMAARITGGEGAAPENIHTVTNAAEFRAALNTVNAAQVPSVIEVAGTISYDDWIAAGGGDREASVSSTTRDLTIVGVGDQALFDGLGLKLHGTNLILRNLTIRYVLGRDAINVNNARYVLITRCTLYNEPMSQNYDKDKYDELISIKNHAQNVIVSWSHLHDSHKTILVGSNDSVEALPDRKLILHHNWFSDSGSRLPLYRGGHAHIYNNYFLNIGTATNVRTGSKILIENNYYRNVSGAIGFWFDTTNPSGLWEVRGNIFENVANNRPTQSTTAIDFGPDYLYTLDPAEDVPAIVMEHAGAGKP